MEIENTVNINHHEVTFNDLAVRELAKGRAICLCRVQFGSCTKEECKSCPRHIRYKNCCEQLSDYDLERLSNYVNKEYLQQSLYPAKFYSYKKLIASTIKWCLIIALALAVICGLACCTKQEQPPETQWHKVKWLANMDSDLYVIANGWDVPEELVQTWVYDLTDIAGHTGIDLNHDNKLNCIDFAVLYKQMFDRFACADSGVTCELVWNYNPSGGLNHLFPVLIKGDYGIEIEPSPTAWSRYIPVYWKENYDRSYNRYDTEERWMKECGIYDYKRR